MIAWLRGAVLALAMAAAAAHADVIPRLTAGPLLGVTSTGDMVGGPRLSAGAALETQQNCAANVVALGASASGAFLNLGGWRTAGTLDAMWYPHWEGWAVYWIARLGPAFYPATGAWSAQGEIALGNQFLADLFITVESMPSEGQWFFMAGFELALYLPLFFPGL